MVKAKGKKTISKKAGAKGKKTKLTEKHLAFCREYLIDLNATRAYKTVYKCSVKVAEVNGCRLLRNAKVQKKLTELIQKRAKRTEITADEVLREVARIALADVGQAFNDDGTLKEIHKIPKDVRRAISAIETTETFMGDGENRVWDGYTRKLKFWSKDKQLENLMKHLGLLGKENDLPPINNNTTTVIVSYAGASKK